MIKVLISRPLIAVERELLNCEIAFAICMISLARNSYFKTEAKDEGLLIKDYKVSTRFWQSLAATSLSLFHQIETTDFAEYLVN